MTESTTERCKHSGVKRLYAGIFICKGCGMMFADQHSWRMEQKEAEAASKAEVA